MNFQEEVDKWLVRAHEGTNIRVSDPKERAFRFIEEAFELVQSVGLTLEQCDEIKQYVYNRPVGQVRQEAGGVLLTTAALLSSVGLDMCAVQIDVLEEAWERLPKIREKIKRKIAGSPLP